MKDSELEKNLKFQATSMALGPTIKLAEEMKAELEFERSVFQEEKVGHLDL